MNRCEMAVANHKKGCNCAQAVACVFADKLGYSEDEIFRLTEAFGGGMGGTQGVCGAVSGMVFVIGGLTSAGLDKLPETNKKQSYDKARELMERFRKEIGSIICSEIKGKELRSCDGCIEDAVRILEEYLDA
jgi:C_GCAxxG_C_C family probable redox protein